MDLKIKKLYKIMSIYNLRVSVMKRDFEKFPKDKTLRDILGDELNEYYDGCGGNKEISDWFFYDVPEKLIETIKIRVNSYEIIKLSINKTH